MELDEQVWQFFSEDENNRKVERAVEDALRRAGWSAGIVWTRRAMRRGSGPADASCVEVWCVKLRGVEPEIRHCLSARDADPESAMVDKFARTFEALRQ